MKKFVIIATIILIFASLMFLTFLAKNLRITMGSLIDYIFIAVYFTLLLFVALIFGKLFSKL